MDINHAAVEKIRTSAQKRAQNGSCRMTTY